MPPVFERPQAAQRAGQTRRGRWCVPDRAADVRRCTEFLSPHHMCCLRRADATVAENMRAVAGQARVEGMARGVPAVCRLMQPGPRPLSCLPDFFLPPVEARAPWISGVHPVDLHLHLPCLLLPAKVHPWNDRPRRPPEGNPVPPPEPQSPAFSMNHPMGAPSGGPSPWGVAPAPFSALAAQVPGEAAG